MTAREYSELLRLRFFARTIISMVHGPNSSSDDYPMTEDEMENAWLAVDKLAKLVRGSRAEAGND